MGVSVRVEIAIAVGMLSVGMWGQETSSVPVLLPLPLAPMTMPTPAHKYWNTHNRILVSSYLALTAADAVSTEHIWRHGPGWSESNPMIPDSRAGRIAYFSATAAGVLGASYLAHRTGHHKWERGVLWVGSLVEAQAASRTWHSITVR